MKKELIALGCGLALLASPALSISTFAEPQIAKPQEIAMYDHEIRIEKVKHMHYAIQCLKGGKSNYALWHLDRILEQHNPNRAPKHSTPRYGTLEDVKGSIEEVVDLNLKDEQLGGWLWELAKTFYEEEKIKMTSDKFKQMLDNRREILENTAPGFFRYVGSNFYHIWIIYNLSLNEARSEGRPTETILEAAFIKVLQAYEKEGKETTDGIGGIFASIRVDLPKGDSELMKKIRAAHPEIVKKLEKPSSK